MKKKIVPLLAILLAIIISIVGCGARDNPNTMSSTSMEKQEAPMDVYQKSDDAFEMDGYDPEPTDIPPVTGGGGAPYEETYEPQTKKIVYHTYLNLETVDFPKTNSDIVALVEKHKGYIQHSSVDGTSIDGGESQRYASYTLRIPDAEAANFLNTLNADFHVNHTSNSASDITKNYYDTESKLKSLEERIVLLQEYVDKAEALEDLLTIEREMSNTKSEIDMYFNMMETMKTDIAYQTVEVYIQEVIKVSTSTQGNTFGERITAAFANSWSNFVLGVQNIAIGIVHNLPSIILLLVLLTFAVIWIRKKRPFPFQKKRRKVPAKKDEAIETKTDDSTKDDTTSEDK